MIFRILPILFIFVSCDKVFPPEPNLPPNPYDCDESEKDECGLCNGLGIPQGFCDCSGVLLFDDCGVCGGNNESMDCAGVCEGSAIEDCTGECNGLAQYDQCGICNGDDSSCSDCLGIPNGNAIEDCLGICNGNAIQDCLGVCNGNAIVDCAGECNGSAQYSGGDCIISSTILEDFSNISDWTILLQCGSSGFISNCSVNYGGWETYNNGYIGSCALSDCGSFQYGNRLTKTFNFPSDGKLTFWYKRMYISDYNDLYVLIDGNEVWSDTAYSWTKVEIDVVAGTHSITFQATQTGEILLDHLEYIQLAD